MSNVSSDTHKLCSSLPKSDDTTLNLSRSELDSETTDCDLESQIGYLTTKLGESINSVQDLNNYRLNAILEQEQDDDDTPISIEQPASKLKTNRTKKKKRKTQRLVRDTECQHDPQSPEYDMVGNILFGNYAILDVIGKGGMAVVYLAKQLSFDRLVALKTLNRFEPDVFKRFSQEADTHCKLKHKNIVSVYDKLAAGNGRIFMVMEHVDGITLRELLAMDKKIERHKDIAEILFQVCDALSYAHNCGIIHRDLKPGNIALFEEDFSVKVKVLDFGLAKIWNSSTKITKAGQAVGSPDYMSPEQCYGKELTANSDVYSLGVVAYKMITGNLPYKADSLGELIVAHRETVPVGIYEYRDDLSAINILNQIVMKALSIDPRKRHQTAKEFKTELLQWYSLVTEGDSIEALEDGFSKRGLKESIDRLRAIKNQPENDIRSTFTMPKGGKKYQKRPVDYKSMTFFVIMYLMLFIVLSFLAIRLFS